MFLLYNTINPWRSELGYFLFTKTYLWEQIHANVDILIIAELNKAVEEIKIIGKYTNLIILKLKYHVQIVVAQNHHLFTNCTNRATNINVLIISKKMPVL